MEVGVEISMDDFAGSFKEIEIREDISDKKLTQEERVESTEFFNHLFVYTVEVPLNKVNNKEKFCSFRVSF